MKKTTVALAIIVATVLSSAAHAAYEDGSVYVGGKIGWAKYYGTKYYDKFSTNDWRRMSVDSDDSIGAGAFIGYQANKYLAFELGYDWLGKLKYKGDDGNGAGPQMPWSRKSQLKVQGVSATIKLGYPILDDLDIYARAGAFIGITKWQNKFTDNLSGRVLSFEKNNDTDVSPTYAIGLDYRLNEDFSARLEYQWINNLSNGGPTRPDIS